MTPVNPHPPGDIVLVSCLEARGQFIGTLFLHLSTLGLRPQSPSTLHQAPPWTLGSGA